LNWVRLWISCLLAAGLLVVVLTYQDYGTTWDEPVQARYGETVLAYFGAGLQGPVSPPDVDLRHYGPAFELAAAAASIPWPGAKYEVRHLMVALTALLGVLGVAVLARGFGSAWVVAAAPLVLALLPRFYGHAFHNSKDIPFAVLFVWALVATRRLCTEPTQRRHALWCGLALGAALAVRPGGLPMILGLFVASAVLALLAGAAWRPLLLRSAAAWAIAWGVMVAFWPFAHQAPLLHPLDAVAVAFAFPASFPVLFEGEIVMSNELPRSYLVSYVLITTPPAVLLLTVIGLARGLREQLRAPLTPRSRLLAVVELWLFVPLLLAVLVRPNVYDGVRHALFVLPALALLAGFGAAALAEWARPGWVRRGAVGALALACLLPLPALVRLHPYQMTYFNVFVGGLSGASGRYETDYWLSGYKEAIEWVNRQARPGGARPLRILVAVDGYSWDTAAHYLAKGIEMHPVPRVRPGGKLPRGFDFYVATTRYGAHRNFLESPIVHEVGRDGALFVVIRAPERRSGRPPE